MIKMAKILNNSINFKNNFKCNSNKNSKIKIKIKEILRNNPKIIKSKKKFTKISFKNHKNTKKHNPFKRIIIIQILKKENWTKNTMDNNINPKNNMNNNNNLKNHKM